MLRPARNRYVGRFAPSPTGDLHLGSLVTALASYLHARQAAGEWLVRIEDIDPPREVTGAADSILRTLDALALRWDRDVHYQSTGIDRFAAAAEDLVRRGLAFRCRCSRREVMAASGSSRYPGTCRKNPPARGKTAIRVIAPDATISLEDGLQGRVSRNLAALDGDYVIFRRDGLPAYHLAVVVDDAAAGVSDVVRGIDLLEQTPLHIHLQGLLDLPTPRYWHVPVVTTATGEKLSKQTGAAPIRPDRAAALAGRLLGYLGVPPPAELAGAPPTELWEWALAHWRIERQSAQRAIKV